MMKFCDWGKNLPILSKIHYLDVSDKQLSDNYLIFSSVQFIYLPFQLIIVFFQVAMYGEVTSRNHQAYS